MLLSAIVVRVIDESGRPDLEELIKSAAIGVIKQTHAKANFRRDLQEEHIVVPSPAQTIRLTLPPRFRKFSNIVIADNFGRPLAVVEQTSPTALLDVYGKMPQKPSAYVSGNTYTVLANRYGLPISYLFVSYYQTPVVENLGDTTWLTELYPEVVVNYALFKVYSKTGNDAKAQQSYGLYAEELQTVLSDQDTD